MVDLDCDFCKYEEKCGLYEYNCPYKHLFNKNEDEIFTKKIKADNIINNLKFNCISLEQLNDNYQFDDIVIGITNQITYLQDMYSDENLDNYFDLIKQ